MPRYVAWEARPRRVGPKKAVARSRGPNIGPRRKTHPRRPPAQSRGIPQGLAPSAEEPGMDPEEVRMARPSLAYSARTQFALRKWLSVSASRRAAGSSLVAHPRGAAALANFRGRR